MLENNTGKKVCAMLMRRLYRFTLRLYPLRFRKEYSDQMLIHFDDMYENASTSTAKTRLVMLLMWDTCRSLLREHTTPRKLALYSKDPLFLRTSFLNRFFQLMRILISNVLAGSTLFFLNSLIQRDNALFLLVPSQPTDPTDSIIASLLVWLLLIAVLRRSSVKRTTLLSLPGIIFVHLYNFNTYYMSNAQITGITDWITRTVDIMSMLFSLVVFLCIAFVFIVAVDTVVYRRETIVHEAKRLIMSRAWFIFGLIIVMWTSFMSLSRYQSLILDLVLPHTSEGGFSVGLLKEAILPMAWYGLAGALGLTASFVLFIVIVGDRKDRAFKRLFLLCGIILISSTLLSGLFRVRDYRQNCFNLAQYTGDLARFETALLQPNGELLYFRNDDDETNRYLNERLRLLTQTQESFDKSCNRVLNHY